MVSPSPVSHLPVFCFPGEHHRVFRLTDLALIVIFRFLDFRQGLCRVVSPEQSCIEIGWVHTDAVVLAESAAMALATSIS